MKGVHSDINVQPECYSLQWKVDVYKSLGQRIALRKGAANAAMANAASVPWC